MATVVTPVRRLRKSQESHDLRGAETPGGVLVQPRPQVGQQSAIAEQHIGRKLRLVDDPVIILTSQPVLL
jgi:hypothetical protein